MAYSNIWLSGNGGFTYQAYDSSNILMFSGKAVVEGTSTLEEAISPALTGVAKVLVTDITVNIKAVYSATYTKTTATAFFASGGAGSQNVSTSTILYPTGINKATVTNKSTKMIALSNAAGYKWIDNVTDKKSQTGRFQATIHIPTDGTIAVQFTAGQLTAGTNSWEPIAKTGTNTSFFGRAMLYNATLGMAIPATFRGNRTCEVSWGYVNSDPIYIPAIVSTDRNWMIYCDTFVGTVGDNLPRNRIAVAQLGEGVANHASTLYDSTMPATRTSVISNNTTTGYCPSIIGIPSVSANPKVIAVYGDSRVDCESDTFPLTALGWEESTWFQQAAMATGASIITIAATSSKLALDLANNATLLQKQIAYSVAMGVTNVVALTWANDLLTGGKTGAEVLVLMAQFTALWNAVGIEVNWVTSPPLNTSVSTTGFYLDSANMSITAGANATIEAHRVTVNTSIRTGSWGPYIEAADAVESGRNTGLWKSAVLDSNGPYTVVFAQTAAFARFQKVGMTSSYGRWRKDVIIWVGDGTVAAATKKVITNSYYALTQTNSIDDIRIDWSGSLAQQVSPTPDTFNRWKVYTPDGLHPTGEIAQAAISDAAVASGVFGTAI